MKILSTISAIDLKILPQDAAYALKDKSHLCFLDSSLIPNKYSLFSYIAWNPKLILKSYGHKNEFTSFAGRVTYYSFQHPLSFLKQNIKDYTYGPLGSEIKKIDVVLIDNGRIIKAVKKIKKKLPLFLGGFAGYFSYDLKNHIEELPSRAADDINLPLFYLAYYDRLLAYGHTDGRWYFIRNFPVFEGKEKGSRGKDIRRGDYRNESADISGMVFQKDDYVSPVIGNMDLVKKINPEIKIMLDDLKETEDIKKNIIEKYYIKNISDIRLHSNLTRRNYIRKVLKAKEYIHNGDIYQANFSQRFEADLPVDPMDLYYILREKNAAPFSAFLGFPDFSIGSSSPERFLFLQKDTIETRPIKGTRPRGKDSADDDKKMMELKNSIKDSAELNMIVDLERNDIGKFCCYGTVKVSGHAVIEKFAKVFHSVSTVTGRVKKGVDVTNMIKAAFPGGSITGAPKIRAMEIIDELEPVTRSVYTGSIGYIGIDSTMDLNIVIRTFIIKGNKFYYNVGGGIVEDSVPEEEYRETLEKGIALEETLKFFRAKNLKKLL
ncbi:MAG: anthranilate synthase component I family protein [Actinomycetota bacterium]|nr:anthranilate synthase component I family protein [Actinomycetota bacterium]